ncbi:Uncharacterised protein [Raoultella ornithinolytica]|nr:Uncharacterised protein [Raoultella ornithinolytica]
MVADIRRKKYTIICNARQTQNRMSRIAFVPGDESYYLMRSSFIAGYRIRLEIALFFDQTDLIQKI